MTQHNKDLPKKYIPYILLAVGIVFILILIRNSGSRTLTTTYFLAFKNIYRSSKTLEIASFAEGEQWKGSHTYDSERTFDDEVGMDIFSYQSTPQRITRTWPLDISPYNTLYAYLFIPDKGSIAQTANLKIGFHSQGKETFFSVTGLKEGWNLVTMPKKKFSARDFDWKKVDATYVELLSKNGYTVEIALDRLWAQNSPQDTKDFLSFTPAFLNMKTLNKNTFLHLASPHMTPVLFNKEVGNIYSYTVGMAPSKFGTFGLVFQTDKAGENGYYFVIEGPQMKSWRMYKKSSGKAVDLARGELKNNTFEKEAYIFIRAERRGDKINLSLSFDNTNYIPLAEVTDKPSLKGYVGIIYKGSYLIDTVEVKE